SRRLYSRNFGVVRLGGLTVFQYFRLAVFYASAPGFLQPAYLQQTLGYWCGNRLLSRSMPVPVDRAEDCHVRLKSPQPHEIGKAPASLRSLLPSGQCASAHQYWLVWI